MKKVICMILTASLLFLSAFSVNASDAVTTGGDILEEDAVDSGSGLTLDVPSAILIDAATGTVLFEKNADEARYPASVTKTMTLLLIAEALADGRINNKDTVCISAHSASMGGSQVFLKEGEIFTVEDLIKCTVIASANDAAVALAEHLAGSEGAFVDMMNARAVELGLTASKFENTTGLDDQTENHTMSARDISIISRELIKYPTVTAYSAVWQDSIRDGEFVLTNTNRLVRYYQGCTGLKTGSTDKAGFCVSASAKRGETELIAVIMGASSGSERNEAAKALLDFGFANYALFTSPVLSLGEVRVKMGTCDYVKISADAFSSIVKKSDISKIERKIEVPESVNAPLKAGDTIGKVKFLVGEDVIGETDIRVLEDCYEISFFGVLARMLLFGFSS